MKAPETPAPRQRQVADALPAAPCRKPRRRGQDGPDRASVMAASPPLASTEPRRDGLGPRPAGVDHRVLHLLRHFGPVIVVARVVVPRLLLGCITSPVKRSDPFASRLQPAMARARRTAIATAEPRIGRDCEPTRAGLVRQVRYAGAFGDDPLWLEALREASAARLPPSREGSSRGPLLPGGSAIRFGPCRRRPSRQGSRPARKILRRIETVGESSRDKAPNMQKNAQACEGQQRQVLAVEWGRSSVPDAINKIYPAKDRDRAILIFHDFESILAQPYARHMVNEKKFSAGLIHVDLFSHVPQAQRVFPFGFVMRPISRLARNIVRHKRHRSALLVERQLASTPRCSRFAVVPPSHWSVRPSNIQRFNGLQAELQQAADQAVTADRLETAERRTVGAKALALTAGQAAFGYRPRRDLSVNETDVKRITAGQTWQVTLREGRWRRGSTGATRSRWATSTATNYG